MVTTKNRIVLGQADPFIHTAGGRQRIPVYGTRITGQIVHTPRPRSGSTEQTLRKYVAGLAALQLKDPTGASGLMDRSKQLIEQRFDAVVPESAETITAKLAAGKMSPEEAAKALAKISTRQEATESRGQHADVFRSASGRALRLAVDALHKGGFAVFELLRGVVEAALSEPLSVEQGERWLHARAMHRNLVGWCFEGAAGARPNEYFFKRFDLVLEHQLNETGRWKEVARSIVSEGKGEVEEVILSPIDAEPLTLLDAARNAEAWGPGLFSAAEVIKNFEALPSR